ncbi:MAG: formamidopyrimidine-DNA glycosidase [Parcubacteria group bacterium Gr01-1014_31]|nr:MAG: formamidopyrimidine-DNA glycosidase [Parcubacteria group bacterium Gr01-1014_31]
MPELPEVETIRRELQRRLLVQTLRAVEVRVPKMAHPSAAALRRELAGKKILAVKRRAKMLVCELPGQRYLVFHLKMTGQLVFVPRSGRTVSGGHPIPNLGVLPNIFTHVIFRFRSGGTLYFNDQRKFGWVKLVDADGLHELTAHLGMEPLSGAYTWEAFARAAHRYPNRTIKQVLMDAERIAGVGNIYADESCFCARLRPTRRVRTIRENDLRILYRCIPRVLQLALRHKGTTRDTYRRVNGQSGYMAPFLNVYGRKGKPCRRCKTPIVKTVVGQRGTHYCPCCQK